MVANGQVNLTLSVSPAQINKDEYATLKITIENAGNVQNVTPPSFKNFIVLSGPNQESSMTSVNGNVQQAVALSFILKPKQTGKLNIEPAFVQIGNKKYKTNATTLLVKNATTGNNAGTSLRGGAFPNVDPFAAARPSSEYNDYIFHKGDNVVEKVNKNMQLRLEVDKTTCFEGEPIVASYKLYTRLKSESRLTENPSFNGFSVIDLTRPDFTGYSRQKLNGREYNVYTIRKAQLYPLQSGTIELEPAELENDISFIKDEYLAQRPNDAFSLFDDFAQASVPPEGIIHQTVSLVSKPVSIIVKPLPEANKPAGFRGAVGDFSILAELQKTSFPSNESGKLIVKISGAGNLQLLTAPVLTWPNGIDPFDPKVSEELDKMAVPVSGSKIFEYNFSVDKPGSYVLPAINFSYFDPKTASYKTVSTKSFSFDVTTPTGPANADTMAMVEAHPEVTGINKIFDNRWWIIAVLGIGVITGLLFWVKKEKGTAAKNEKLIVKDAEEVKIESMVEVSAINQQNPLQKTEECLFQDDCTGFYTLLNTELKDFLSHKLSVSTSQINTKDIAAVMDKKNIGNDIVLQTQKLLQEIEWQLYTPFERNEKMKIMYEKAHDIVQLVNTSEITSL